LIVFGILSKLFYFTIPIIYEGKILYDILEKTFYILQDLTIRKTNILDFKISIIELTSISTNIQDLINPCIIDLTSRITNILDFVKSCIIVLFKLLVLILILFMFWIFKKRKIE
jgi:predicted PurR-regulated permease PerM